MWILLDSNDLLDKEYAHLVLDVKVEEGGVHHYDSFLPIFIEGGKWKVRKWWVRWVYNNQKPHKHIKVEVLKPSL